MDTVEQIFGVALTAAGSGNGVVAASADGASQKDERPAPVVPTTFPMCRLAAFVMDTWRVAVDHRRTSGVDERLRYALLSQTCQYSEAQKAKMRAAGIDERIFSPIPLSKNRRNGSGFRCDASASDNCLRSTILRISSRTDSTVFSRE